MWLGRFVTFLQTRKAMQAPGRNLHLDPKESTKPCLVPLRITPVRGGPPPLRRSVYDGLFMFLDPFYCIQNS